MKKVWYSIVIMCCSVGLCTSITALFLVPNQVFFYLNSIFFWCVGILVGILELLRKENDKPSRQTKIILSLLTITMLSTGAFVVFTSGYVFSKLVSVSGLLLSGYVLITLLKKTKASREKEIILPLDYESAFEKSWKALKWINAEVNKNNKAEGFIFARTGRSWRSGGEELIVNLQSLNKSQTHIKIISEPMPSRAII
ncbi:MAG: hypothetical protein GY928_40590, partial [Colwellia sp.]|nr:hypothetical protein [Colwellia sp.]